ncbi:hypothetical protein H9L39_03648 [Fusarium oxysporum f. sp. albedinis]|nr:hypothetical protein H9L39_03648 [Fusarium oxysporum f. sp. albedinis]
MCQTRRRNAREGPHIQCLLSLPHKTTPVAFFFGLVGLLAFAFFQNFEYHVLLDLNGELGGRIGVS